MNDAVIAPESHDELQSVLHEHACSLAVGNRTKPSLSSAEGATLVSLRALSGIITYEPSEFTFTARAGTLVSDIAEALAEKGQYLPFDPMLVHAGGTIGGTVASGMSGPGRFRYGGIRDFLLGVQFLSGDGKQINSGGKVVKNAAGFDIPKFMVGSLGRFGVMTELSFKVFPRPVATCTLGIACESHRQAIDRIAVAASSRWELDAIDYRPSVQSVALRLAGPDEANRAVADEIGSLWGGDVSDLSSPCDYWRAVRELSWTEKQSPIAVKVPTTHAAALELFDTLAETASLHWSVAGAVLWILLDSDELLRSLDEELCSRELAGLVIRGRDCQPRIGRWISSDIEVAVKSVMDPPAKFPGF